MAHIGSKNCESPGNEEWCEGVCARRFLENDKVGSPKYDEVKRIFMWYAGSQIAFNAMISFCRCIFSSKGSRSLDSKIVDHVLERHFNSDNRVLVLFERCNKADELNLDNCVPQFT